MRTFNCKHGAVLPDLDTKGKIMRVVMAIVKLALLLGLLYLFICSLDVLSSAFQLVGGEREVSSSSDDLGDFFRLRG